MIQRVLVVGVATLAMGLGTVRAQEAKQFDWTPTPESVERALDNLVITFDRITRLMHEMSGIGIVADLKLVERDGKPIWVIYSTHTNGIYTNVFDGIDASRDRPSGGPIRTSEEMDWAVQMRFFWRNHLWIDHAWLAVEKEKDGARAFAVQVVIPERSDNIDYEFVFLVDALYEGKLVRCTVNPDIEVVKIEDYPAPAPDDEE